MNYIQNTNKSIKALILNWLVKNICDTHSIVLSYALQISNKKTALTKQKCNLARFKILLWIS